MADDLREMPCEDYHQFNVFVQGSPTSPDGLTVDIINTDEGPDDYSSYSFGSWKHVWKCKDVRVAIKSAFYQGMNVYEVSGEIGQHRRLFGYVIWHHVDVSYSDKRYVINSIEEKEEEEPRRKPITRSAETKDLPEVRRETKWRRATIENASVSTP